ncbi:WecB/TagA/CpsF family glycosyltransferase [Streptomyces sp. SID6673]|nr:WecB/TagA/CpsF family glycosyltransferase [Streptomyces sp. SID11726]NEB27403.1 WecB/TagA/CpsF family glycosyltransferase [Streptomyces sp. SID6673]
MKSQAGHPRLNLWGVPIDVLSRHEALSRIALLASGSDPAFVSFANAHVLNLAAGDPEYRRVLQRQALVLNDGIGVSIAARMFGVRFPDNLNGTDLSPQILEEAARRGHRIAFIGARPGIAERAAVNLRARIPELKIVFTSHGFVAADAVPEIVSRLSEHEVDIVFVAMGCPLQEKWSLEHLADTSVALTLAVGAFFDFAASDVPRAPRLVRKAHLEWAFRLLNEPRRLFVRYVVGNPRFLFRAAIHRMTHTPADVLG